jgi:4-hydroxy-tetrahydrodipicolinate reductase
MKIALIGYGKMGKAIEEIAIERGHSIVLRVNSQTSFWENELNQADVAIEFTQPDAALANFMKILSQKIPLVTGTTGWNSDREKVYAKVSKTKGTFLSASNFSVGVNLFFEMNRFMAQLMCNQQAYKVEIEEIHHTEKKDAPSGTAISVAEDIIQYANRTTSWFCPQNDGECSSNTNAIKINAVRKEGVPGTHFVNYISEIDEIQLVHTAKSRKGFALGAVLAAEFVLNKKGIFTMKDVLQLTNQNK